MMYSTRTGTQFAVFESQVGGSSPYKELRKTRSGYHSKWLLLKSPKPQSIRRTRGYFAVQACCFPKQVQHEIIMSKSGLPIIPEYEDIMECMETWGNGMSHEWAQDVYHYLYENIKNEPKMKEVVGECIWLLMKERCTGLFAYTAEATINTQTLLLNEWLDYFDAMYGIVTTDFFSLVVGSKHFLEERISWVYTTTMPAYTPQLPVVSESSDVIPPSPVSRWGV